VPINPIVDHHEGDCLKERIDISVIKISASSMIRQVLNASLEILCIVLLINKNFGGMNPPLVDCGVAFCVSLSSLDYPDSAILFL